MTVSAADYTALITQQHRKSPKFVAMVETLCGAAATVNNVSAAIIPATDPATATGKQQNMIAEWVGLARSVPVPISGFFFSWDDSENPTKTGWDYGHWRGTGDPATGIQDLNDQLFRPVMQAKILANQWKGDINGAYAIVRAALGSGVGIKIVENVTELNAEIAATTGNDLTITENPAPGHYYESTVGNDLNVSETADTDAYIASTVSNALTVTANPLPHYIESTVENDLLVETPVEGSASRKMTKTNGAFTTADIGKSVDFISANGAVIGRVRDIYYIADGSAYGFRAVGSGLNNVSGTYTGGLWGFSTETIIDAGDFILTAASSKFASGDAGTKTIRKINAAGATVAQWAVMEYTSGTVVGANLLSGTSGSAGAGLWGYSTEDIIIPGEYTLDADSAKFAEDSVTRTIRINDTDGEPVALFEVMTYEDSTTVTANLTSGTAPESEVEGGAWDFSTASVTIKDLYLLECEENYFSSGNIGDSVVVIDLFGDVIVSLDITSYEDQKNVGANYDGFIPGFPELIAGGLWGLDSETITRPAAIPMKMIVRITGANELQKALFTQNILPIKPAGVTIEYVFVDA